jgi:ribosomal protein S14
MKHKKFISDLNKRRQYKKIEILKKVIQTLFLYSQDSFLRLILIKKTCSKNLQKKFKTHIRNYCVITGRSRGVSKQFKVSRIAFRSLNNKGIFFGLKKASW